MNELTGKRPTTDDVTPAEIFGEHGFFSVERVEDAVLPVSIVAAAVAWSGVQPDATGMWGFYRSGRARKLIVVEPITPTKDDLALEHDPNQTGFRRYRDLANIQLPQSVWTWADITFPCVLYCWHSDGKIYVRRRITQEDWDASAPRWEYVRPTLRSVVASRGGFPATGDTAPPRR